MKFLGFSISISFIYFRYFAAKLNASQAETAFGWMGTFASLAFGLIGFWALIFKWSDRIKDYPLLSRQANEIEHLCSEFCALEHPSKEHELYKKLLAIKKQFETDKAKSEAIDGSHIRHGFQELCRKHPNYPMKCHVCNGLRKNVDYARFKIHVPYLDCHQCGCKIPNVEIEEEML